MTVSRDNPFRKAEGFMLLELLLALSIVSMSLVALIHSFSLTARARASMLSRSQALSLLQAKRHDLAFDYQSTVAKPRTFDPPFEKYRWAVETGPLNSRNGRQVKIIVLWGGERHPEKIEAETYLGEQSNE